MTSIVDFMYRVKRKKRRSIKTRIKTLMYDLSTIMVFDM